MAEPPVFSLIVPAHNESSEIGDALTCAFAAAQAVALPFEVIVVNDASTDATGAIARRAGAQVIDVNKRHIAAVRNAGAREARSPFLFFVDADTRINATVLRQALAALEAGAIGGGAYVHFDQRANVAIRCVTRIFNMFYMGLCRWAAGCFVFATRHAFDVVGGFDERLYATEEIDLSRRLKTQGRFIIVPAHVVTSSRKMRLYSNFWPFQMLWRLLIHGPKLLRQRKGLELWYEGKRETPRKQS